MLLSPIGFARLDPNFTLSKYVEKFEKGLHRNIAKILGQFYERNISPLDLYRLLPFRIA
jgi:hypothetical protein